MFRAGYNDITPRERIPVGEGGLPYKGVTGVIVVPFRVKICSLTPRRVLKSKMP